MDVRAGIIVTGTEVLTGATTDRNGPWTSQQLAGLGVDVAHIICVGDRTGDLEAALRFLEAESMNLIITTGGLGPTADDLTAQVVADFSGRAMLLDEAMEERITKIIAGFARRMNFDLEGLKEGTRKQAMIPKGAQALDPAGTAPGLVVPPSSDTGSVVIVLPGPPRELQAMWPAAIASPAVAELVQLTDAQQTASMKMFGIPESTLAKTLRDIEDGGVDMDRLEVTTCLRRGAELEIDVRYREEDQGSLDQLFAGLRQAHGDYIYTEAGESIDEIVAGLLEGKSIGVAESCSGGLMAGRLTELPGASSYFAGGIVAYSNRAKQDLAGVDPELISEHGAVSVEVAEALADGALDRFSADVGVGITGIAGPDGGSDDKPVGYVCLCVKSRDGKSLDRDPTLPGRRNDVRERSVSVAMHMLRRLLLGQQLPA